MLLIKQSGFVNHHLLLKDKGWLDEATFIKKMCSFCFSDKKNSNNTFHTDFVTLGPVKEEEVYLQPRIVLYHGLISDAEIDTIKVCQLDTTFCFLYALEIMGY